MNSATALKGEGLGDENGDEYEDEDGDEHEDEDEDEDEGEKSNADSYYFQSLGGRDIETLKIEMDETRCAVPDKDQEEKIKGYAGSGSQR